MSWLVLNGSRSANGQTATATKAFLEAARGAGVDIDEVYLPTLTIERCRQCNDDGWGLCMSDRKCVINDDFPALVEKVRNAELVVFSTPVYFSDLSESMKAFTDRLRRICIHGASKDRISGKPAVGICVAGGGGGGSSHCAAILETTLSICGFAVASMTPVRRQNLVVKCDALRAEGRRFASNPVGAT